MISAQGEQAVSREEFTVMFGAIQNMQNQMTAMKRDLVEERTEANELLVKRLKLDKKPLFKKKAHEKQFEFNEEVRSKLNEASSGENATPPPPPPPPALEKVKRALQEGEDLIKERQKLIKIADRSEHGWATVEEYVADELADNSDDEKRLYKAEARAGRKVNKSKIKKKPIIRRNLPWSQQTQSQTQSKPNSGSVPYSAGQSSQTNKSFQLSTAGPCFQCGKIGHFRRACPLLTQTPK